MTTPEFKSKEVESIAPPAAPNAPEVDQRREKEVKSICLDCGRKIDEQMKYCGLPDCDKVAARRIS